MICLNCGHLNDAFINTCSECGSVLAERPTQPPEMLITLDQLALAAEQVEDREMSSGEFREMLNGMEEKFRKTLAEVEKYKSDEMDDSTKLEMADEMKAGISGIKGYLEAFKEMHQFLASRDPVHLDRGMLMAEDANRRLNEALRINFENYVNIQETAEEFLRSQTRI